MHSPFLRTAAGLWLGSLLGLGLAHGSELASAPAQPGKVPLPRPIPIDKAEGSCGSFGTSVEFVDTPSAAARLAKKEQKLVFVLHVSGHFEDPRFT